MKWTRSLLILVTILTSLFFAQSRLHQYHGKNELTWEMKARNGVPISNGTRNCTCLEDIIVEPEATGITTAQIIGLIGACFLVCLSALFSGLTLGLLGLDTTGLEILCDSGKPKERIYAARILPVRRRGNLLLCTLLLGNVMVNAGISVLTTDITSGLVGFLVSSAVITIFGEILPQAVCSRYGLFIGAHTIWLIYIVMVILFPIAFPISFILDKILGKEMGTVYSRDELKTLVNMQVTSGTGDLNPDEARIVGGALELSRITVANIMTPLDRTFMLDINDKLNYETITTIWQIGHSRIPVYQGSRNNIVGLLFAKDLLLINPDDDVPLATILTFYGREVIKVYPDTKLDEMLKIFKTGRSHIAIIHDTKEDENGGDPYYVILGLVSLEDVIEEILREEILDETDIGNKIIERNQVNMFGLRAANFQRMTPKQVVAAASYLYKSHDLFRLIPESHLHKLLGKSQVVKLSQDQIMYQRNEESDYFSLILYGRVEVKSGQDNFVSENGPWSFLGVRALSERKFIPDFTAKVLKETQVVKITKEDFVEIIQQCLSEDENFSLPSEMKWMQSMKLQKLTGSYLSQGRQGLPNTTSSEDYPKPMKKQKTTEKRSLLKGDEDVVIDM